MRSIFNIFSSSKNKSAETLNFSILNVDMHSHLIPGIDDGAKTMEESINLIKTLHGLGFTRLITTPHIMTDYYKNTPEIINAGLEQVREVLKVENIPVEISAAAEYYVDDGFLQKLEEEKLMTFGDNYLLTEISYINPPDNLKQIFFRAQVLGYKPILAHPERYPFWYNNFDEYRSLRDTGVLLQLNLNSLAGYYGPDAKKAGEKMIDLEMIDMVGTDMHHNKHGVALHRCLNEKYLPKVLEFNLLNKHL